LKGEGYLTARTSFWRGSCFHKSERIMGVIRLRRWPKPLCYRKRLLPAAQETNCFQTPPFPIASGLIGKDRRLPQISCYPLTCLTRKSATPARDMRPFLQSLGFSNILYLPVFEPLVRMAGRAITHSRPAPLHNVLLTPLSS